MIQDWLSSNKNRAYPFKEDSDMALLPKWCLLDLRLYDSTASAVEKLACTGFRVEQPRVYLDFEYGGKDFTVPILLGSDISFGTLNIEECIRVKFAVYGGGAEYECELQDAYYSCGIEINPANVVCIQKTRKVSSINGVTGKIHIKDGYNSTARIVDNAVVVSIGNNYGLGAYCKGGEDLFDCSQALMFINGQHADTAGNINVFGGSGVSVQTGRTALVGGRIVPAITIKASDAVTRIL